MPSLLLFPNVQVGKSLCIEVFFDFSTEYFPGPTTSFVPVKFFNVKLATFSPIKFDAHLCKPLILVASMQNDQNTRNTVRKPPEGAFHRSEMIIFVGIP